jgi:hypothetical protein
MSTNHRYRGLVGIKGESRGGEEARKYRGKISGSHGGKYEDPLASRMLRRVIWENSIQTLILVKNAVATSNVH